MSGPNDDGDETTSVDAQLVDLAEATAVEDIPVAPAPPVAAALAVVPAAAPPAPTVGPVAPPAVPRTLTPVPASPPAAPAPARSQTPPPIDPARVRTATPAPGRPITPPVAAGAQTPAPSARAQTPPPIDPARIRTATPAPGRPITPPSDDAAGSTAPPRAPTPAPVAEPGRPLAASPTDDTDAAEQLPVRAPTPAPTEGRRAASVPPTDRAVTPLPVTPRAGRAASVPPTDRAQTPPSGRTGVRAPSIPPTERVQTVDSGGTEARSLPTASIPDTEPWAHRIARIAPWVIVVLPAVLQLFLLSTAITGRIAYPYDLEWMEGGMLHHAQRIHGGLGLYVPPSIEFIPYLYTPLYPSLLALFGGAFGLSYTLGRAISVVALIGIAVITAASIASKRHQHARLAPAVGGIVLALGLFSAAYPFMEGWYDLVRADTLFLFMVTAGISGLPRWAAVGKGLRGHARVAAGAVLLALAFFCKQTGIIYVAFGGLIVLVVAWRRVPVYVLMAGLIGLGGTWLLQTTTDGWFWIYIREIHAAHDFNWDRFYKSFEHILWHFPAMSIVIGAALLLVIVTRIWRRVLPRATHPLLLWSATFVVSTLIGAIGWGTEFAHFNAYMPAFLHGAIAAGAAVPAVYGCMRVLWGPRKGLELVSTFAALAAAVPLALACYTNRWEPTKYMPTARDIAAGERLIARIHAIDGDVWMPSHPWYLALAGKSPRVHRMGIKDVTWRQTRTVDGLDAALEHHAFAALVLDGTDVHNAEPATISKVNASYRAAFKIPPDERPRVFTGARVNPDSIWVPAIPARPPTGTRMLFDFEQMAWEGWTLSGAAWGARPETELAGHDLLLGATGRKFATSMHGGDAATGRVTSPEFDLDGTIAIKLGGGTDATKLRVELWVGAAIVATASVPGAGGETLRTVTLDAKEHRGARARLVFVDDSRAGHLDADDVWITP